MGKRADILERFGQRVRELRTEQEYSQEAFAYACEIDRTYMGGIERGERNVALRNIEVIAETLGLSVSELLDGIRSARFNQSASRRVAIRCDGWRACCASLTVGQIRSTCSPVSTRCARV